MCVWVCVIIACICICTVYLSVFVWVCVLAFVHVLITEICTNSVCCVWLDDVIIYRCVCSMREKKCVPAHALICVCLCDNFAFVQFSSVCCVCCLTVLWDNWMYVDFYNLCVCLHFLPTIYVHHLVIPEEVRTFFIFNKYFEFQSTGINLWFHN